MNVVLTIVLAVQMLSALGMIGLILVQHGKGADMGAAFGSGASGSLFGVSGSSNFMSRATAVFVAIFFTTSMSLAYLSSHRAERSSVIKAPTMQIKDSKSAEKPVVPPTGKDVPQ